MVIAGLVLTVSVTVPLVVVVIPQAIFGVIIQRYKNPSCSTGTLPIVSFVVVTPAYEIPVVVEVLAVLVNVPPPLVVDTCH